MYFILVSDCIIGSKKRNERIKIEKHNDFFNRAKKGKVLLESILIKKYVFKNNFPNFSMIAGKLDQKLELDQ